MYDADAEMSFYVKEGTLDSFVNLPRSVDAINLPISDHPRWSNKRVLNALRPPSLHPIVTANIRRRERVVGSAVAKSAGRKAQR